MRNDTKNPPRPRGRPRKFDPDAVIRAASERFRTGGFEGTSLDDLAAATGLNRPSLYAAFGDKRALYLAALERAYARVTRAFDSLAEIDLDVEALLRRMFAWTIDGFLTGEAGPSGCIAVSTAATASVEDAEVRAMLERFLTLEDERIAGLLRKAGSPSPEAHGRLVAAVIHSLSTRTRAGASRAELDRLAEDCIALILADCRR